MGGWSRAVEGAVTARPQWSKMARNTERKAVAESRMTGEDPALQHLPHQTGLTLPGAQAAEPQLFHGGLAPGRGSWVPTQRPSAGTPAGAWFLNQRQPEARTEVCRALSSSLRLLGDINCNFRPEAHHSILINL